VPVIVANDPNHHIATSATTTDQPVDLRDNASSGLALSVCTTRTGG